MLVIVIFKKDGINFKGEKREKKSILLKKKSDYIYISNNEVIRDLPLYRNPLRAGILVNTSYFLYTW